MIDDILFDRCPEPAVVFGRHVLSTQAGTVSYGAGTTRAAVTPGSTVDSGIEPYPP